MLAVYSVLCVVCEVCRERLGTGTGSRTSTGTGLGPVLGRVRGQVLGPEPVLVPVMCLLCSKHQYIPLKTFLYITSPV